jgi:peroxiredoxin
MKKTLTLILFFVIFSGLSLEGQETDYAKFGIDTQNGPVPKGLKSGDKAPLFAGYDQTGKHLQSTEILKTGPMILFFYRGKWDSSCSKYLNNYQDSLNILTGMGVNLIAITPESIENVEQTVKLHNLAFTVVYDCQEQIMMDYQVMFNVTSEYQDSVKQHVSVDIAINNGRDVAHLPVPATYIISREGIIAAVFFNPDYRNRASVKWMIQNLGPVL